MSTCKGKGLVAKFDTNTRNAPAVRDEKLDTKLCPSCGILHIVIALIAYRSSLRDYLKSALVESLGTLFRSGDPSALNIRMHLIFRKKSQCDE
jgi:hypothetical protein